MGLSIEAASGHVGSIAAARIDAAATLQLNVSTPRKQTLCQDVSMGD